MLTGAPLESSASTSRCDVSAPDFGRSSTKLSSGSPSPFPDIDKPGKTSGPKNPRFLVRTRLFSTFPPNAGAQLRWERLQAGKVN
jgi:hypothetical protein